MAELKGLKGIGELSKEEYDAFVAKNEGLISRHKYDPRYIKALYNNKLYIDRFGIDAFRANPDQLLRDQQYRYLTIMDAALEAYGPHGEALGDPKYNSMDLLGWEELLNSNYKPKEELKKELDTTTTHNWEDYDAAEFFGYSVAGATAGGTIGAITGAGVGSIPGTTFGALAGGVVDLLKQTGERVKDKIVGRKLNADEKATIEAANQKVLDDIYSRSAARALESVDKLPYIEALDLEYAGNDKGLDRQFNNVFNNFAIYEENKDNWDGELDALTKGSNKASLQKEWLADYYALSEKFPTEDGSIHPIVKLAINDKIQNYVADRQGWFKRNVALPSRQIAVTMETKALQISTGFENDALQVLDNISGLKFDVYVDTESGKIVPTRDVTDENGNFIGDPRKYTKTTLDRSLLHRMGVNTEGEQLDAWHNPRIISAMQTTNVFDSDAAMRYFELGYSPYVPTMNVGEELNLAYSTANMVGQFTFDAVSAWLTRGAANKIFRVSKPLAGKIGMYSASVEGLGAIGEGYALGHMEEVFALNLLDVDLEFYDRARQEVDSNLNSGEKNAYTDAYYSRVEKRTQELLDKSISYIGDSENGYYGPTITPGLARQEAETLVLNEMYQEKFLESKASNDYKEAILKSIDAATETATMVRYAEMAKYGYHYLAGYRNYFVSDRAIRQEKMLEKALKEALFNRITNNGKTRLEALKKPLELGIGKFTTTIKGTPAYITRSAWNNIIIGGGLSNATDEMVTGAARSLSSAEVNAYLNNEYRGNAVEDGLNFFLSIDALTRGALGTVGSKGFNDAFIVGAVGSGAGFMPNFAAASTLLTKKGRLEWNSFGKGFNSEKASFLINNGFLGGWALERALDITVRNWAGVVNTLLDENDDFDIIMDALATNHIQEKDGFSKETKLFLLAISSIALLENLMHNSPLSNEAVQMAMGEEVENVLQDNKKLASGEFSLEDAQRYLAAYYSKNSGISRSQENDTKALSFMLERAKLFQQAREAMDNATKQILETIEASGNRPISNYASHKIALRMAISLFAESRLGDIELQIKGSSAVGNDNVNALGNIQGILHLVDFYNELSNNTNARYEETLKALLEVLDEINEFENRLNNLPAYAGNTLLNRKKRNELYNKKRSIQLNGITELERDAIFNNIARKKPLAEEALRLANDKETLILSADEIINLSPVLRYRMLANPELYSIELQALIAEADSRLSTNPMAKTLIKQAAQYYNFIQDSKNALGYINQDIQRAAEQIDASVDISNREISEIYIRRGVKALNSLIDLADLDNTIDSLQKESVVKSLIDLTAPLILERTKYPQYQHLINLALKKYDIQDILSVSIDAAMKISPNDSLGLEKTNPEKAKLRDLIKDIVKDASSREEAADILKEFIQGYKENDALYEAADNTLQYLELMLSQDLATTTPSTEDKSSNELKNLLEVTELQNRQLAALLVTVLTINESLIQQKEEEPLTPEESLPIMEELENKASEESLVPKSELDVDLGLVEEVNTPTVEEEAAKLKVEMSSVPTSTTNEVESANIPLSEPTLMLGNPIFEYDLPLLNGLGKLKRRVPLKEGDLMDLYFKWLDSKGILLLEIIDNELEKIVATNPDVHFLLTRPLGSLDKIQNLPFLVVKYTDKIDKIHNKDRGGVISVGNEQYLIIGSPWVSYLLVDSWNLQLLQMKTRRKLYLDANPSENYYIDTYNSTKIADIAPGRIVKLLLGDETGKLRTLSELLSGPERNPRGLQLEDLDFGILVGKELKTTTRKPVLQILDKEGNNGAVFLLIETANGKLLPAKIKATTLNDLKKDSLLKTEIYDLLLLLTSSKHSDRYNSILKLKERLVLTKEDNIWIGNKDTNILKIKRGGEYIELFDLNNSNLNPDDVIKAIESVNFRIQIGISTVRNPDTIRLYDDAGCLTLDIAKLGTSNASFSVYSVNDAGQPIEMEVVTPINSRIADGDLSKTALNSVLYLNKIYREFNGTFYDEVNNIISDSRMITQLLYNLAIESKGLKPVLVNKSYEYYILDSNRENPICIKREIGSHYIEVASKDAAIKLIDKIANEAAEKQRKEVAERQLKVAREGNVELIGILLDVNLGLNNSMTPEQIERQAIEGFEPTNLQDVNLEENELQPTIDTSLLVPNNDINGAARTLAQEQDSKLIYNLGDIFAHLEYGALLDAIIDEKIESGLWQDFPDDMIEIEKYLHQKRIQTTDIGTTVSVELWLDMIKNCR